MMFFLSLLFQHGDCMRIESIKVHHVLDERSQGLHYCRAVAAAAAVRRGGGGRGSSGTGGVWFAGVLALLFFGVLTIIMSGVGVGEFEIDDWRNGGQGEGSVKCLSLHFKHEAVDDTPVRREGSDFFLLPTAINVFEIHRAVAQWGLGKIIIVPHTQRAHGSAHDRREIFEVLGFFADRRTGCTTAAAATVAAAHVQTVRNFEVAFIVPVCIASLDHATRFSNAVPFNGDGGAQIVLEFIEHAVRNLQTFATDDLEHEKCVGLIPSSKESHLQFRIGVAELSKEWHGYGFLSFGDGERSIAVNDAFDFELAEKLRSATSTPTERRVEKVHVFLDVEIGLQVSIVEHTLQICTHTAQLNTSVTRSHILPHADRQILILEPRTGAIVLNAALPLRKVPLHLQPGRVVFEEWAYAVPTFLSGRQP